MEPEHLQDRHQETQYQVRLSGQMLETTLLYMCKRQRMTLKNFKYILVIVLSMFYQKLTRDKELGTKSENK